MFLARRVLPRTRLLTRSLAVPAVSAYAGPAPPSKAVKVREDGTLRPHLKVDVRPDHGLYHFFHRDGDGKLVTIELADKRTDNSGRSWSAAELRRKSFRDLHTLWYLLLRERNVLATQAEEWKVVKGLRDRYSNIENLGRRCRKSMARIKYVLNERRLAFKGARLVTERRRRREKKVARKQAQAQAAKAAAAATATASAPGASVTRPAESSAVLEQSVRPAELTNVQ